VGVNKKNIPIRKTGLNTENTNKPAKFVKPKVRERKLRSG
jgi:hypothetical protein